MKRVLLATTLLVACAASAQEKIDLDMTGRIRQEAFQRSQVMATLNHLTDVIGPVAWPFSARLLLPKGSTGRSSSMSFRAAA